MSIELVEKAWTLSEAALALSSQVKEPLSPKDYWDKLFQSHPDVDVEKTLREAGPNFERVFLRSPYGLVWRPGSKDWIPFRHGHVEPPKLPD